MTKCKEVTEGYTTREDCDEWPVQRCSIEKKKVKKYTPETKCHKEPKQMCAARGCGFSEVSCFYWQQCKLTIFAVPGGHRVP